MFSNLKRVAAAAATAGAIALMGASGASAATSFHVGTEPNPLNQTGTMAINASAGTSRLVVNNSVKLECTTTTASGSISTGLFSNTGTQVIGSVLPAFTNCTGPLGLAFTVVCSNPSPNTTSLAVTSIPTPFTGTTRGEIVNISCVVRFTATGCTATITGSVPGSYQNPATPSTPGRLTVFTAGQSLTVSGSGCTSIIPNGTAQYGAPVGTGLGLTDIVYTLSGGPSSDPYITPTP